MSARLEGPAARGDPRVGKQIVDERRHPVRALHGKGDVLSAAGSSLPWYRRAKQLDITRHCSQRLLKIMGCCIGELLQLSVGPFQFSDEPLTLLFGPFPVRNIDGIDSLPSAHAPLHPAQGTYRDHTT